MAAAGANRGKTMKNRGKFFAAAALAALAAGPAAADHSWASYHWPIAGPDQPFEVLTKLNASYWNEWVDAAVADWDGNDPDSSGSTDYLKPAIAGEASTTARRCNPTAGKVVVCGYAYGFRGWLGVATIWASGNHITQATTKLNESYHNSGTYGSDAWRQLVTCQEIGHDFGLGHQNENFNTDETDSCMEYTSDETNNRTPDAHDYQQLQIIYDAHMAEGPGGGGDDGGGNCNPRSPKCSGQDAFNFREVGQPAPRATEVRSADWGTAVGFDAHGRPNVFELEVRKGYRKITHVTWVPGFRPQARHLGDHHL